jgi:nucleotide-binding universal stress UspA family protein
MTASRVDETRGTRPPRVRRDVIAAISGSAGSHVLRVACQLARRTKRSLSLVSVIEPPNDLLIDKREGSLNPWYLDETRERRTAELEALLDDTSVRQGVTRCRFGVLVGDPATAIAELARASDAAVIVMGIGPHRLRDQLFGRETTLATARHGQCPVLAVHPHTPATLDNVVIAVDFSPESIHAARQAIALVGETARVHLVHVWKRIEAPFDVPAFRESDDQYELAVPQRFIRVRAMLECAHSVDITTHIREGEASAEITTVAREVGADLVVVGMRGLRSVERLFMGSVSTEVLRSAACSVMLVPGPEIVTRREIERLLDGCSTETEPEGWGSELAAFARRNHLRRTTLEIDDHELGAQRQSTGYLLTGATYDRHDDRIALMLGGLCAGVPHVTHAIGGVQHIAISSAGGRDQALCIESDEGRAILLFLDP